MGTLEGFAPPFGPGCGAIQCLKIVPGFVARPDIFVGARLLWPREEHVTHQRRIE